jgi:hypothetical protein
MYLHVVQARSKGRCSRDGRNLFDERATHAAVHQSLEVFGEQTPVYSTKVRPRCCHWAVVMALSMPFAVTKDGVSFEGRVQSRARRKVRRDRGTRRSKWQPPHRSPTTGGNFPNAPSSAP